MVTARANERAVLLPSGKVLAIAGYTSGYSYTNHSELYSPANNAFIATGDLNVARSLFGATLLRTRKVLVEGGLNSSGFTNTAELYDPATGQWSSTGGLVTARYDHTATLLPGGKVLIVGGCSQDDCYTVEASAEIYDPNSGSWTPTGSMSIARHRHTAILLSSGKVLVAGGTSGPNGDGLTGSELYDPRTGTWQMTGSMSVARAYHTATLLSTGQVLVAGGAIGAALTNATATAELYNPASGAWALTGSMSTAREGHAATLLANGKTLVGGGLDASFAYLSSAELYNPSSATWSSAGNMQNARGYHRETLLPSGTVLATGGVGPGNPFVVYQSSELYKP